MIFMGYTFAGGSYSLDSTPANSAEYNKITVGQGQIDELLGSKSIKTADELTNANWDFDTILRALFNGNALAGNIDYAVSEIDSLRLKRRKKGDLDWILIAEKAVTDAEDLSLSYDDKTAGIGEYEYAVIPVMGGVEGSFFANSIESKFNGMFIADASGIYGTDLEVSCTSQTNQPTSVVVTLARKYPYIIHNPTIGYESGSASGYFVENKADGYDIKGGLEYRNQLDKFLINGLPKILKIDDGRMWLVDISSSSVAKENKGHYEFIGTSFEWTESGDCNSQEDLYSAGLIGGDS